MAQDVWNTLEKFDKLLANPRTDGNTWYYTLSTLFVGYIHLTHRLKMLRKAHQQPSDHTDDPLTIAARLYREPRNQQLEVALDAQRSYFWKPEPTVIFADRSGFTQNRWIENLQVLRRSDFKAWRIIQELCGVEKEESIEYESETAWGFIHYVRAIRLDSVAGKLPKISMSTVNQLIPRIQPWINSKNPDCHPLEVVVTALLESLARVGETLHCPPRGLTRLVSDYMRRLASSPNPCEVKIPEPDELGRDQEANDTFCRLDLTINHRVTFSFVQMALTTEFDAVIAADLYESFEAMVAELARPDDTFPTDLQWDVDLGSVGRTILSDRDDLQEKIHEVRAVYLEVRERFRLAAQEGLSTAGNQQPSSGIRPQPSLDDDDTRSKAPPTVHAITKAPVYERAVADSSSEVGGQGEYGEGNGQSHCELGETELPTRASRL